MKTSFSSLKFAAALFLAGFACSLPVAAGPATTIPDENPTAKGFGWTKECEDRVAAAQGQPIDIIFVGDSITQNFVEKPNAGWNLVGRSVWDAHYANRNALNLGVGSDGTEHILYRLEHENIKDFTPKVVVLLAGINDSQYSPEDIADGLRAVVNKLESLYPAAKIVLMNVLPSSRAKDKMDKVNQLIQPLIDNQTVFGLDLAPDMPPVGDNWKGLGGDHLHLTEDAYKVWARDLDPLLDKLMQP